MSRRTQASSSVLLTQVSNTSGSSFSTSSKVALLLGTLLPVNERAKGECLHNEDEISLFLLFFDD